MDWTNCLAPWYSAMWFGCEEMPCASNVMSTSMVARGPAGLWGGGGGAEADEDAVLLCFGPLDFRRSFSFSFSGDVVAWVASELFATVALVGSVVIKCGANALANTRTISSGLHVSFMPSLNLSSLSTKTSSLLRTPSVTAAASISLRRVSPSPSLSPVLMHRIFKWFDRDGCVNACSVGEKNMDSSSGCAIRRMMRLLRRFEGTGGIALAVMCQSKKTRTGARRRVTTVVVPAIVRALCRRR